MIGKCTIYLEKNKSNIFVKVNKNAYFLFRNYMKIVLCHEGFTIKKSKLYPHEDLSELKSKLKTLFTTSFSSSFSQSIK